MRKFNWQILTGFLLCLASLASYPTIFSQWPITRDFPWANLLIFAIALVLLFVGLRRAFNRGMIAKVAATIMSVIGVGCLGLFVFVAFVLTTWMPAAASAPAVGSTAPEFSLKDSTGQQVTLTELRTAPIDGQPVRGVALIFYRGYW